MGQGASRAQDHAIADLPEDERYFGLENFGNTCYCNSVLQALYFCLPFRKRVLQYAATLPGRADPKETILTCLAELFAQVGAPQRRPRASSLQPPRRPPPTPAAHARRPRPPQVAAQRKKTGYLSPRKFVARVKAENELFSSHMHQDAHEFLNYLLNDMSETLAREAKATAAATAKAAAGGAGAAAGAGGRAGDGAHLHTRTPSLQALHSLQQEAGAAPPPPTWLDGLFQGRLVSETRCLRCEAVTSREEPFFDLSLEIDQNVSVTSCLRRFSGTATLDGADKFSCDACGCKQEAQKRMRVAALPPVLCLHLKRFKYTEQQGQMGQ